MAEIAAAGIAVDKIVNAAMVRQNRLIRITTKLPRAAPRLEIIPSLVAGSHVPDAHAVVTGVLARIVSKRVIGTEAPALFTAALLHDIGKVVLNSFVEQYSDKIMELVAGGVSFLEAEETMLGIDHAQLGGKIAESWDFPEDIVRGIALHHEPEEAPEDVGHRL